MAKTYNNLFSRIYDFQSLHQAYILARRGKRDRREVQRFEQDLEGNLISLQNELIWNMYSTGKYRLFRVYEPKERLVAALPFRDRVLQHSLVNVIEPIWERRFIADSYACRPGRGTHRGADRAQSMLRGVQNQYGRVYVLKADIAKYFYSIDHAILKRLIRRRIRCRRTLDLIDAIIDSNAPADDLCPVGLPIGNLTSQLFANVYLHELDTYVKHHLREKYYVRYMDDFAIFHHDKAHLQRLRKDIERFLWENLRLRTNAKTQVFPVGVTRGRALDFLGYRIWVSHRRVRRSSIARIKRTMRRLQKRYSAGKTTLERVQQSVQSWVAHASHAQTYGLRKSLLASMRFARKGDDHD
ncbi:reverse transcriptase/maturase family protein [Castellaniella sp. S9]|uniref:reverse transcriptase/maturase family protein n=1 Tax=Castellaniella sp. S9 TaxID=2993652 RepID=UPI0022B49C0A|nr:reverse transcriptase/maturase family protein [Castellaniella sp. S9]